MQAQYITLFDATQLGPLQTWAPAMLASMSLIFSVALWVKRESMMPNRGERARVVIGVDVVYPPQHSSMSNPVSVLFQTMLISSYRLLLNERALADVMIAPVIETTGQLGLRDREWLIKAGETAAQTALPQLKAAFGVQGAAQIGAWRSSADP